MSVETQIERIKTNIANAYTAAEAKGATIPEVKNSENLSACVDSITTGGGGDTQFGLTAEQMLGTLDSDGNLTYPTLPSITFTGLKSLPYGAYYGKFRGRVFETGATVSFPDLVSVDYKGMEECFFGGLYLVSADLSKVTTANDYGLSDCFNGCSSLLSLDMSLLASVGSYGMITCFASCSSLTSVTFPSLVSIDQSGFRGCFSSCSSLETVSFPALTTVNINALGSTAANSCFYNCTALTEIHFRADAQAAIEGIYGYADKWGATNATIYFDL